MLSSNSLKEMLKSKPKRIYRPETFAYSNKSKKLHFSVALLLKTFSTDEQHTVQFRIFFITILHFSKN